LQETAEDSSEQLEEVEENNVDQDELEDSQLSDERTAILEKKIHLEEELEAIDRKLHGAPTPDELGAQSSWAEYMNAEVIPEDA